MPAVGRSGSSELTGIGLAVPAQGQGAGMRWVILVLLSVLTWMQYRLWVGTGSLAEVHNLKQEIARQGVELEQLRARNRVLIAEVQDLKQGVDALEERARAELGMVKEGEVFFQLVPKAAPAPPSAPARGR